MGRYRIVLEYQSSLVSSALINQKPLRSGFLVADFAAPCGTQLICLKTRHFDGLPFDQAWVGALALGEMCQSCDFQRPGRALAFVMAAPINLNIEAPVYLP